MNPLPALRRAMSDLIPERPAYPYDPLLDNYAPEQPFHIQWRRGSVDGQQSPVTTHMASPPIRFRGVYQVMQKARRSCSQLEVGPGMARSEAALRWDMERSRDFKD
ncbi:hypothetical protein OOU_Y34scaffold00889g2 [Pyricularia oryzae Y34]|uniref:Uncharacterized protein n=1 Tax=Pyricularia oryzae (strain Y34) TaxID=1143189 RepID=A0AA97NP74_PYRO3|nr:hypothetical protein OOU_Y34scaffold00889g2 [Pyricularia oryzae Y34]